MNLKLLLLLFITSEFTLGRLLIHIFFTQTITFPQITLKPVTLAQY